MSSRQLEWKTEVGDRVPNPIIMIGRQLYPDGASGFLIFKKKIDELLRDVIIFPTSECGVAAK